MNPKITIAVDAKNKAIASLTGLVTVGAKVDVEITGLPSGIPNWAATDKWYGPSVRFRVVDETGRDLVRFPLVEKSSAAATDGDQWHKETVGTVETYKTNDGTNTTPVVNFDTDVLRKAMHGLPFDAYREFGLILDSVVDAAQYAIGKIKVRQWALCPTEDPTVLPDWRETLEKLQTDLAAVETAKTDAQAAATTATTQAGIATTKASDASNSANAALSKANEASASATAADESADDAEASKYAAIVAKTAAEAAASHYPYIGADGYWYVWENGAFVKKDKAQGPKGDDGTSATISVHSTVTGAAGTNASVTNEGTSSAANFKFTIPRGANGSNGLNGSLTMVEDPDTHKWYKVYARDDGFGNRVLSVVQEDSTEEIAPKIVITATEPSTYETGTVYFITGS